MYQTFTFLHSLFRWVVLLSLIYAVWVAFKGYYYRETFSKKEDSVRHWTATIAHIQLVLGIILYSKSPIVQYFWKYFSEAKTSLDLLFFGLIHIFLMLTAIVLVTVGSALAKRKAADREKFKTMLIWFTVALAVIFMAIPWPFSPFANRPYFR
ncbi:hypothetical protein [Chryseobacterium luteum]|uniref:Cytochrome B561 n=1 Tax=Chryseobacterium luteum TaxID=421531 RepID=A0A085ZCG9_9FLAO|nr:hypothetical protein [Chryseobacterium luteum]KFF02133.1 hypothetical protein IX38_14480 [Chryseobacterium luteum]